MTLPEKCRMLIELAKETIADKDNKNTPAWTVTLMKFHNACSPTTVAEICEAYLKTQFILDGIHVREARDIQQMKTRIQELEAALKEVNDYVSRHNDSQIDDTIAATIRYIIAEALAKAGAK